MKLIHISDIHLNPEPIMGSDPEANFAACLDNVSRDHQDADMIVLSGDLAHHGLESSYRRLETMLAERLTTTARPRLLIGNHDDRETFKAVFPDAPTDAAGFVQWTEDTPLGRFVYLDTNEPGTHSGHYCARRRAWLERVLADAARERTPVWLFMHHNPAPVHVANADLLGIVQEAEFRALLAAHPGVIRHLFFGHCHYSLSGSVEGVPFSAPRSTSHPNWPDFSGDPYRVGYGGMAQNYNVCFLEPRSVVVHSVDFLAEPNATWIETREDGWIDEETPEES